MASSVLNLSMMAQSEELADTDSLIPLWISSAKLFVFWTPVRVAVNLFHMLWGRQDSCEGGLSGLAHQCKLCQYI